MPATRFASPRLTLPLLGAFLVALSLFAQDASRLGKPVVRPDLPPRESTYGFLVDFPTARIAEPGKVTLSFRTAEPTPPVRVYFGLSTLAEDLDIPHYRMTAVEPGEPLEPRSEHTVALDLAGMVKLLPTSPFEPKLNYRIEAYLPSKRWTRMVDGQVFFDPATLGDTENIVTGPVVDLVTETSAVISWSTDRPCAGEVEVAGRKVASPHVATRHEVPLTGLRPATSYSYAVRAGRTRTREYAFRTAGGDRFTFAALIDGRDGVGGGESSLNGVNARSLHALIAQAYRRGTDLVVCPGDLVFGPTTDVRDLELLLASFNRTLRPLASRVPVYEGMGNHDYAIDRFDDGSRPGIRVDKAGDDSSEAVFARTFVNPTDGPEPEAEGAPSYLENVYSFRRGNALFIVLNNNYWSSTDPVRYGGNLEGHVLPRQVEWLRARMAAADGDSQIAHVFVFAHEPPFPHGYHAGDAMWHDGGDTNSDGKVDQSDVPVVESRNALWSIVASSAKTVAFVTGDEHSYARILVDDTLPVGHKRGPDGRDVRFAHPVWQVTAGGAGAPFYDRRTDLPWSARVINYSIQPHVALFRVDGARVDLEVVSSTGQVLDQARLR
ncbi:MAG: metallophosphoesterase family protein [Acidobacteria bacterium]|nr:metallophosphoesterase family protein [Acidobacteriota bacterium]